MICVKLFVVLEYLIKKYIFPNDCLPQFWKSLYLTLFDSSSLRRGSKELSIWAQKSIWEFMKFIEQINSKSFK